MDDSLMKHKHTYIEKLTEHKDMWMVKLMGQINICNGRDKHM